MWMAHYGIYQKSKRIKNSRNQFFFFKFFKCCKKKICWTGFTCRCGNLLCSIHRYSDKHNCKIDYKELGAEEIRKNNPMVTAKESNSTANESKRQFNRSIIYYLNIVPIVNDSFWKFKKNVCEKNVQPRLELTPFEHPIEV